MSKHDQNPSANEVLNMLLDQENLYEESTVQEVSAEKLASEIGLNPLELSEDQLAAITEFELERGRIRAIGFNQQLRKEAADFFKAAGLDPESLAKMAGAGSGTVTHPVLDTLSKVLEFIYRRIHPIVNLYNYKPGDVGEGTGGPIDPESAPILKGTQTKIFDRNIKNVESPKSFFKTKS